MAEITLAAKLREKSTKSALNQLRREGYVPGVFYSKDQEPLSIYTQELSLNQLVFTSETNLINLEVDNGKAIKSIIKDIQFDPVTDRVVHFDLLAVTVGQSIQLEIPIVLVGDAVGVKSGGRLQLNLHKAEIECLPKNIPEQIEIDVTSLEIGDSIHVSDLSFDSFKILNDENVILVSVLAPRAIEVTETVEEVEIAGEESTEPEVIGKGKAEEEEKEEGDKS